MTIRYEPVTPGELRQHWGPRRGAVVLARVIEHELMGHGLAGRCQIYNRRVVAGTETWSLHAVGRAIDVPVRDAAVGRLVALHVVQRHARLGVCEVIGPDGRWHPNGGPSPRGASTHQTHVHLGLTRSFADSTADPVLFQYLLMLAWRSER